MNADINCRIKLHIKREVMTINTLEDIKFYQFLSAFICVYRRLKKLKLIVNHHFAHIQLPSPSRGFFNGFANGNKHGWRVVGWQV